MGDVSLLLRGVTGEGLEGLGLTVGRDNETIS